MTLGQKYKYARIVLGFVFVGFLIATTIVAIQGKYILFGALLLILYLILYVGGKIASKTYIQVAFVKFLKSNGGSLSIDELKTSFVKSGDSDKTRADKEKAFPWIVESLLKDGIIKQENDIIKLNMVI